MAFGLDSCRAAELEFSYPIDSYQEQYGQVLWRAINIDAPPAAVYPWLTQLRFAPYSYDCIDNGCRPSPRYLIPDTKPLKVGNRVMFIFETISFTANCQLSIRLCQTPAYLPKIAAPFGHSFYLTYQLFAEPKERSRLVVKIILNAQDRWYFRLSIAVLNFLDYIMMRKQLINFKALAEREFSQAGPQK